MKHQLENALKSCYINLALSAAFSVAFIAAMTPLPRWSSDQRRSQEQVEAIQWN